MRPSGVHFRFMLNYCVEDDVGCKRNVYPLFLHYKMLKHLRRIDQEKIYDIDRFELTFLPDLQAIYKLDLREGKKPGFIMLTTSDTPSGIHAVELGRTFEDDTVFFKMMFNFTHSTPLITGYLQKQKKKTDAVVEKRIFDFPIELLYGGRSWLAKLFRVRKRLLGKYHFKEEETVYGPFPKPLEPDVECELTTVRYVHRFVTFLHEIQ